MTKRRKRKGSKKRGGSSQPPRVRLPASSDSVDVDALWESLRQGAANVAGVSYQIAVSALLLVDGIDGNAVVEVTPEGFEDVDCTLSDGSRVLVQAKERSEGLAKFGVAEIRAAIEHAADALAADVEARLLVITDAEIPASVDPGQPLSDTAGLENVDQSLLARASVMRVGWHEVVPAAIAAMEVRHGVDGAVAALGYDRLVREIAAAASKQRATSRQTAIRRTASDLEGLLRETGATVDLAALTEAEAAGVIAAVDFTRPLGDEAERFLRGVDVVPGHIAAELDFLRVDELARVFDALGEDRYAVIAGPSGSGKSALLWRAAFELSGRFKLARLRGVGPDQVEVLARFARLQAPSDERPLLVCVDDLGRPAFSAWTEAADALLEIPHVYLLASVRNEDLTTAMLRGRARPVEPRLDAKLAREIAAQAGARGIETQMEFDEALSRADGLLMEFVSLLIAGRRLEVVIAAQVEQRLDPARATERELLRLVSCAHAAGLSLDVRSLGALVGDDDSLPAALNRLRDEFLVTEPVSGIWAGLHELRSERVTELLHRNPPPTYAETVARLAHEVSTSDEIAPLLLHAARARVDLSPVVEPMAERLTVGDAREAASLLQMLMRVDGFVHARDCLEVARQLMPDASEEATWLAFAQRFLGIDFASTVPPLRRVAEALPEPPQSLAATACASLSPEHAVDLVRRATLADGLALCEALVASAWPGKVTADAASGIWSDGQNADLAPRARLLAALAGLADAGPYAFAEPLDVRVAWLAQDYRDILRTRIEVADDVRLELAVFDIGAEKPHLVEIAQVAYDLCPEVDHVRIEVIGPSGRRSARIDSVLSAPRENVPNPRLDIRRNVLFREGLERAIAASSWSERLRAQEQVVTNLRAILAAASQRLLHRHDNARRRREWLALVQETNQAGGRLPAPPLPGRGDPETAADPAKAALKGLCVALSQLAQELDGLEPHRCVGIASQIRDAMANLDEPVASGEAGKWPITRRLAEEAHTLRDGAGLLADLLLARAESPATIVPRRREGSWDEAAAAFVRATRDQIIERERAALELALVATPHVLTRLPSTQAEASRLVDDRWLVLVTPDNWDEFILRSLPLLDAEARSLLAHRTWAMPHVEGVLVPVQGIVLGRDRVFPLARDDAERIAADSGRPYVAGATLASMLETLELYVEADRAAAHARLRGLELDNSPELHEAERLLAEADQTAAALQLPDAMRNGFAYLAGLVKTQITEEPPITLSAGEDWLAASGQSNMHVMLADLLITGAIQLAAGRGEVVRPG